MEAKKKAEKETESIRRAPTRDPKRSLDSAAFAFAYRDVMEYPLRVLRSFHFDVRESNHLAPLFGFVRDELSEVGGRARSHRDAQLGKPCLHIGVGKGRIYLLVEPVNYL